MTTKARPAKGHRRAGRPKVPAWSETEEEFAGVDVLTAPRRGAAADGEDESRQSEARRRLEQYMESKRLRANLQEVFYDEELW